MMVQPQSQWRNPEAFWAKRRVLVGGCCHGTEPINLGSNHGITIRRPLETIVAQLCVHGEIIWDTNPADGKPGRKDVSRSRTLFDFEAHTPFEEGEAKATEAYREAQALAVSQ